MTQRLLLAFALLCTALIFPWWVSFIFCIYIALYYTPYEALVIGFLLDRLYGVSPSVFFGLVLPFEFLVYSFLLLYACIFLVSVLVKKSLIYYA
jgi:hypothetical protein